MLKSFYNLSDINVGSRKIRLPNGVNILASVDGANHIIKIDVTEEKGAAELYVFIPFFIHYQKNDWEQTSYRFGFYLNEAEQRVEREVPYGIEEKVYIYDAEKQLPCLTEQFYLHSNPTKTKSIKDGKLYGYGNQYVYNKKENSIYTFWHSGHGDLPHLIFERDADLIDAYYLYMPALVELRPSPNYVYMMEDHGVILPVFATVYRNGTPLFSHGTPGTGLIAGLGFTSNGDILYFVSSFFVYRMFRYKPSTQEVQVVLNDLTVDTLGDWGLSSGYADRVLKFNSNATKFCGLLYLSDDEEIISGNALYEIEWDVSYDSEEDVYSVSMTSKTRYERSVTTSINSVYSTFDDGGDTLANSSLYARGANTTLINDSLRYPIGITYDDEDTIIRLYLNREITTSQDRNDETSRTSTLSETTAVEFPFGADPPLLVLSDRDYTYIRKDQCRNSVYSIHTVEEVEYDDGEKETISDLTDNSLWDRTHYLDDTHLATTHSNARQRYTYCDGRPSENPTDYIWDKEEVFAYHRRFSHKVDESVNGYVGQLRFIDTKMQTIFYTKLIYSSTREGENFYDITQESLDVNRDIQYILQCDPSYGCLTYSLFEESSESPGAWDSVSERVTGKYVLAYDVGGSIIKREEPFPNEVINASYSYTATVGNHTVDNSSGDCGTSYNEEYSGTLRTTPLEMYPRRTAEAYFSLGDNEILVSSETEHYAPTNIRLLISYPVYGPNSVRIDPTLSIEANKIITKFPIALVKNGPIDTYTYSKEDLGLIYNISDMAFVESPTYTLTVGTPALPTYTHVYTKAFLSSFSDMPSSLFLQELTTYPIGWGFLLTQPTKSTT